MSPDFVHYAYLNHLIHSTNKGITGTLEVAMNRRFISLHERDLLFLMESDIYLSIHLVFFYYITIFYIYNFYLLK